MVWRDKHRCISEDDFIRCIRGLGTHTVGARLENTGRQKENERSIICA